jgi:hypothetical protein
MELRHVDAMRSKCLTTHISTWSICAPLIHNHLFHTSMSLMDMKRVYGRPACYCISLKYFEIRRYLYRTFSNNFLSSRSQDYFEFWVRVRNNWWWKPLQDTLPEYHKFPVLVATPLVHCNGPDLFNRWITILHAHSFIHSFTGAYSPGRTFGLPFRGFFITHIQRHTVGLL